MLESKTVLIAGVGSGLGAECARLAIRDGANVVLGARTESQLEAVATEVDPGGGRSAWLRCDIADASDCESLAAAAVEKFGAVDAVVQVAAFEWAFGGLFESDFDAWRTAFDTNVIGAMQLMRAVVPRMKEQGGGSVVLIGSQSMYKPALPQPGYAASKGALLSAMYYLVDEFGPDAIRVNMVVPSWMWGPPVQRFIKGEAKQQGKTPEEVLAAITAKIPLGRMAADEDVAEAVMFFCSDRSQMISGQTLMVNAGEIMR